MNRCQVIKDNHMRCSNKAWVFIGGLELCKLHYNFWMGCSTQEQIESEKAELLPGCEHEQKDLDKIIKFHTTRTSKC